MPEKKKYFIASDFHLEFWQGKEKEFWEEFPEHKETKVCLCAGDLTSFGLPDTIVYKHFTGLCKQFDKVIYVPGNHEYYGSSPSNVALRLAELENHLNPSLKVLRSGGVFVHDGQRFLGDTMWFPDRPEVHIYRRMINDAAQIRNLFPWAFTESNVFMVSLRENVRESDIVITHHIPNDINTASQWRGSPTQSYFVNKDCHNYFINPNTTKPKVWVYGHTHDYHDFMVDNTRCICNPIGYTSENPQWRLRSLVYEI